VSNAARPEFAAITADINSLEVELREAQRELNRLRQIDRAQRTTHEPGAPLQ
jgi:hypothetical protein